MQFLNFQLVDRCKGNDVSIYEHVTGLHLKLSNFFASGTSPGTYMIYQGLEMTLRQSL